MVPLDHQQVVAELEAGQVSSLTTEPLSEAFLQEVATRLTHTSKFNAIVATLLSQFAQEVSRNYDWNCGSLLQHAPPEVLFSCIPGDGDLRARLRESIGLTWCLGQFLLRDQRITDFLEETVALAVNPQSWWRAAFSLERIGLVDAISYLKAALKYQGVPSLDVCLNNLGNERSRIGILLQSDSQNLLQTIFPRLRTVVVSNTRSCSKEELLAAVWLLARLNHHDEQIRSVLKRLARDEDYEIQFYSLQAISRLGSPRFVDDLLHFLGHDTPHLRVIAAEGLGKIDLLRSTEGLRQRLRSETDEDVLGTVTESLYALNNYSSRQSLFIVRTVGASENGMIVDKADKWYGNPSIYHEFSACQDPENVCFGLLEHVLEGAEIVNPIDLGSGTGRLAWYFLEHFDFNGQLFCLDASDAMCHFLKQRATRECISSDRIAIRHISIDETARAVGEESSSLVMANFAFPSRYSNQNGNRSEMDAVHRCLRPGGKLITIGWDETFNDELSEMWYRFVPDGVKARNFEEWRHARAASFHSARNCNLTWFRRGLRVNLQYPSNDSAARVMGYLFGRGAVLDVVSKRKTCWTMSMGMTIDTRENLKSILDNDKRRD